MAEGGTVLSDLVLRKTLGVADQDLVLSLVQGTVDGGNELGPAGTQSLGGEGGKGRGEVTSLRGTGVGSWHHAVE